MLASCGELTHWEKTLVPGEGSEQEKEDDREVSVDDITELSGRGQVNSGLVMGREPVCAAVHGLKSQTHDWAYRLELRLV